MPKKHRHARRHPAHRVHHVVRRMEYEPPTGRLTPRERLAIHWVLLLMTAVALAWDWGHTSPADWSFLILAVGVELS